MMCGSSECFQILSPSTRPSYIINNFSIFDELRNFSLLKKVDFFVAAPPIFLVEPTEQKVAEGAPASLDCIASGNPTPNLFWMKESSPGVILPATSHGHVTVTPEGTLRIGKYRLIYRSTFSPNTRHPTPRWVYNKVSFRWVFFVAWGLFTNSAVARQMPVTIARHYQLRAPRSLEDHGQIKKIPKQDWNMSI
jgi:hypothetical protein